MMNHPQEEFGYLGGMIWANYLGALRWFASSCTDFVVSDGSIADLADPGLVDPDLVAGELVARPQASGGLVISCINTR